MNPNTAAIQEVEAHKAKFSIKKIIKGGVQKVNGKWKYVPDKVQLIPTTRYSWNPNLVVGDLHPALEGGSK